MNKQFNLKIENFEGPFDLLLKLVNQQKLDIGKISISSIIDQFLDTVSKMKSIDLDVSSDFMLVTSTLLKIKTDALLKIQSEYNTDADEEISPINVFENLKNKLCVYKQFNNAAKYLQDAAKTHSKFIPRYAGPDPIYLNVSPDFLKDITLNDLGHIASVCFARRDQFLLDSKHIASKPISVATYVKKIHHVLIKKNTIFFSDLIDDNFSTEIIVVNFLAMLELYKRNYVDIEQRKHSEDILIKLINKNNDLLKLDKDLEGLEQCQN